MFTRLLVYLVLFFVCATGYSYDPPAERSHTLKQAEEGLRSTDYRIVNASMKQLESLAQSRDPEQSATSQALIERYAKEARTWLEVVGNPDVGAEERASEQLLSIRLSKKTPPQDMRYVYYLPKVTSLHITGKGFEDAHLRALNHLPELEILDVYNANVTGACLKELVFPKLKVFRLGSCPVTSEAFRECHIDSLSVLDVSDTEINNDFLAICSLTQVQALYLNSTGVTGKGLSSLPRFEHLQELRIDATTINDASVEAIASCKEVRVVQVYGDRINLQKISEIIAKLPNRISVKTVAN